MGWTHLSDRTVKARKPYQCELCERPITVGEVHVSRAGLMEGDFRSFRMHATCEAETRLWDEYDWDHRDAQEFRRAIDARAGREESSVNRGEQADDE